MEKFKSHSEFAMKMNSQGIQYEDKDTTELANFTMEMDSRDFEGCSDLR